MVVTAIVNLVSSCNAYIAGVGMAIGIKIKNRITIGVHSQIEAVLGAVSSVGIVVGENLIGRLTGFYPGFNGKVG